MPSCSTSVSGTLVSNARGKDRVKAPAVTGNLSIQQLSVSRRTSIPWSFSSLWFHQSPTPPHGTGNIRSVAAVRSALDRRQVRLLAARRSLVPSSRSFKFTKGSNLPAVGLALSTSACSKRLPAKVLSNPSLEPTRYGMALGRLPGVVHHPYSRPSATPALAAQLKR